MSSKKRKIKPSTAIIIAVAAVILVVSATLAWYFVSSGGDRNIDVGNFDANAVISLEGGNINSYKNADGTINVNLTNPNAGNYIGKLRVNAQLTGVGSAYMRLKLVHEFKKDGLVIQSNVKMPYVFDEYDTESGGNQAKWFDNRNEDFCLYYATEISGNDHSTQTVNIINGFDASKFDSAAYINVTLSLAVELQAIQINRYDVFWNLEKLPWKN